MIYLKYLLIFILGWLASVILGGIIGAIFSADKSKIGGFITGLLIPPVIIFIISKIMLDPNSENRYDLLPITLILLPYILINIRGIYNSGVQDGSGNNTYGVTGIEMKANKGLIYGGLIGCVISLIYFTNYY
jgi:uncharacterized membrane protein